MVSGRVQNHEVGSAARPAHTFTLLGIKHVLEPGLLQPLKADNSAQDVPSGEPLLVRIQEKSKSVKTVFSSFL